VVGCTNTPSCPDKELIKNQATCFDFFKGCIAAEQYSDAHDALSTESKGLLRYEIFYSVFRQYSYLRRLVATTFVHGVSATAGDDGNSMLTLCNHEFGFSTKLPIKKEFGIIWTLVLTQKDLELFTSKLLAWLAYQKEIDGQLFVYPSNWNYHKLWDECPCGKK
jgi:hypothetical protein